MPHPWKQDRVELAVILLSQPDADMDAVLAVLMPRLWERSGLKLRIFHAMVRATLPGANTALTQRRSVAYSAAPWFLASCTRGFGY